VRDNRDATAKRTPSGIFARLEPALADSDPAHSEYARRVKVLVTGGAGFIGSNLVRALLAQGEDVRVIDNFATGNRANLAGLARDVELVEGELRSYERVHNAVRGVEVVFHLGALGSVPRSVQDPLTSSAVNVEGTLNVLLAARDEGIRRVVFASSSSVYGNQPELPLRETMAPDPISPYGVAKLAAERYCVSFARVYHSVETVVLRYFNVFGPRQDPRSQYAAVVPLFITAIAAGEPVTIFDDGEQSRDFTYVDNVVAANLLAADAEGASGRIFNVSSGAPATVNELADTIARLLGKPVERRHLPPRPGDLRDSWADVSEARDALGYEPSFSLEDGLRRTAEFLLDT
jgi:UDP-glucose 4-epimerase